MDTSSQKSEATSYMDTLLPPASTPSKDRPVTDNQDPTLIVRNILKPNNQDVILQQEEFRLCTKLGRRLNITVAEHLTDRTSALIPAS